MYLISRTDKGVYRETRPVLLEILRPRTFIAALSRRPHALACPNQLHGIVPTAFIERRNVYFICAPSSEGIFAF